mgnify:CR=1 FL=1
MTPKVMRTLFVVWKKHWKKRYEECDGVIVIKLKKSVPVKGLSYNLAERWNCRRSLRIIFEGWAEVYSLFVIFVLGFQRNSIPS